jgi:predicted amidophosphoribosyltransferase
MPPTQCPDCGLAITYAACTCPLCQASLIRINRRRALLWATVIGEFLLILVLNLAGRG